MMAHQDIDKLLPQDWEKLSIMELIKIILEQQLRLKTLEIALYRLEQQLAGDEVATSPEHRWHCPVSYFLSPQPQTWQEEDKSAYFRQNSSLFLPVCTEIMLELGLQKEVEELTRRLSVEQQTKMEKAVRNALRSLNDIAYLGRSRLIKILAETRQLKVDGSSLQRMLNQIIEQLKPHPGQPDYDKWRIRYDILCSTYREKQSPKRIAVALSLSERQYYRELKIAIESIVEYL